MYPNAFVLTTTNECNDYTYNVDIKLIPFRICLSRIIHQTSYSFCCCCIYNKRKQAHKQKKTE